jgi:2,4-dienoyl-CoA reductase-like NADH-dependent reductase (Old Yellow Enzyme family)
METSHMKIAGVDLNNVESLFGLRTPVEERPLLFRPITIRGVTFRNRIIVPPMSQYMASTGTGMPTDWHLVHLSQFAMGGAGLVFCEETAVEARGRRTHNCTGIYTCEQAAAWRRITTHIKDLGAVPGIQLGHAGQRASVRSPWEGRAPLDESDILAGRGPWQTVSSSAVADRPGKAPPIALDRDEIKKIVQAYRDATLLSLDAGFEVAEIHGGHGYLLFQFLSPFFNQRTDAYGGDLQGRMRFVLEVTEAVREAWPKDRPLFFRPSAVDGIGGYWDIDDTTALSKELKLRGVDVLDVSSGSGSSARSGPGVPKMPGYHVIYADHLRRETGLSTVAVGGITDGPQAEAILQQSKADLIGVAREMLCDPYWAAHAAKTLGLSDWQNVLPPTYTIRLSERERERTKWKPDETYEIPFRRDSRGGHGFQAADRQR